jgi:hypothetical protein
MARWPPARDRGDGGRGIPGCPGGEEDRQPQPLAPQTRLGRAIGKLAHHQGVQGQERVEDGLRAEGPRLRQAPVDGRRIVDLQKTEIRRDPPEGEHARETEPDRDHGEGDPVGGDDAQHPRGRVPRNPRRTGPKYPRAHERPVQEEAGDQEEDRHPDDQVRCKLRQGRRVAPQGRAALKNPCRECRMEREDRERGEPT